MFTAAVGCSDEETPVVQEETNHQAMGVWVGSFTGGDSGNWELTVDKDGLFSGEVYSNNGQAFHPITGEIDENGVMTAIIDVSGVILDFTGQQTGSNASGTWGNPSINLTGTWTGTKK